MTSHDRRISVCCVLLGTIACATITLHGQRISDHPGEKDDDGFVVLFDGKTLDGWHAVPEDCESDWSVNDGVIVGRGSADRLAYLINDKLASEFTDQSEDGALDHGAIGLQIHDKGMQVEFADIRLQRLVASHDRRKTLTEPRAVAPPPGKKYLLLDSRVVESIQNAKLVVGAVQKHKSNPLFKEDRPWEPRYDNVYANVIYDEQQALYKCWYSPFVNDPAYANTPPKDRTPGTYMKALRAAGERRRMGVCYATSKDGIHWTKPLMDIRLWDDKQPTNIVDIGPHGSGIMKDLRDEDPRRRYKMFMKENGVSVEFSRDGLHWSDPIRCPEIDAAADTHNNAFWAPELERYVGITRLWSSDPRQRVVGRTESPDFLHWTQAVEVFRGDPARQIYAMPVFRYAGVYIGLPVIFQPETDRSHTELAWSSDTIHWHRIDPGTPLIPTSSNREAYDWGCVYGAACPIVREDEIRLYYGASNGPHTDWRDGFFALATLRPDGFAGYQPVDTGKPSVVVTSLVSVAGDTLRITADAAGGSIRVTAIAAAGNELATSQPITEDVTDRSVVFSKDFILSGHGNTIRLRFELDSATLYAFSFRERGSECECP